MDLKDSQTVAYINDILRVRPCINKHQIEALVKDCYGLQVNDECEPKELVSYDDRNFLLKGCLSTRGDGQLDATYSKFNKFVLKIFNSSVTSTQNHYNELCRQLINLQLKCEKDFKVPYPIQTTKKDDNTYEYIALYPLPLLENVTIDGCNKKDLLNKKLLVKDSENKCFVYHLIRLTVFIEGCVPDDKKYLDDNLAYVWGKCGGLLNKYLPGTRDAPIDLNIGCTPVWNMLTCSEIIKTTYLNAIKDGTQRKCYLKIIKDFEEKTLSRLKEIDNEMGGRCWIHSDLNDLNLVVNDREDVVLGVIDFDDMSYSYKIIDVGISMMYACVKSSLDNFMKTLRVFYQGYASVNEISELEQSVLYNICMMRFVQSTTISTYQYTYLDPGNEYLMIAAGKSWNYLVKLMEISEEEFLKQVCSKDMEE